MDTRSQLLSQASQAFNNRDFVNAHKACVTLIRTHGDDARAQLLEGKIHIELSQLDRAIECIERSILLEPFAEAFLYLAKCHSLRNDQQRVARTLARISPEELNRAANVAEAAKAYSKVGLSTQAIPFYEKALQSDSENPLLWYDYAQSLKNIGEIKSASTALEKAISLKDDFYQAYFALSTLPKKFSQPRNIARLEGLIRRAEQQKDVNGRLLIGHALAHEYELAGQFDKAYQALYCAKACRRKVTGATEAHVNAIYDWLMDSVAESQPQSLACQSERPVFIVGMPGTGITLVERILSSHSQVVSGSQSDEFPRAVADLLSIPPGQIFELPNLLAAEKISYQELGSHYLQRTQHWANENARFVTDRFPFNFFYLSLIRRALPNAKILCLVRDPLDTCLSSYRRYFSTSSPYFDYSYDLAATGRFYKQFYGLMQRWQQHAPDSVHLQSYEALVTQPQEEIATLFDFCGLSREEQYLSNFRTAQLSDKHIGNWRRYGAYTADLENLFSD